jgi:hypothetical protein
MFKDHLVDSSQTALQPPLARHAGGSVVSSDMSTAVCGPGEHDLFELVQTGLVCMRCNHFQVDNRSSYQDSEGPEIATPLNSFSDDEEGGVVLDTPHAQLLLPALASDVQSIASSTTALASRRQHPTNGQDQAGVEDAPTPDTMTSNQRMERAWLLVDVLLADSYRNTDTHLM